MKRTWTEEQEALLTRIWPTGESLKRYMAELGDRPYISIISHAHKVLKLGSRPKSARGVPGYAWAVIHAELQKSPGSASELIKRTGLTTAPVYQRLRDANPGPDGEVHIVTWRKRSEGGTPTAVYALGPGENAPMPVPYTTSEKWKIRRVRRGVGVDPFAVALGRVPVPAGAQGRVVRNLLDDDREAA